MPSPALGRFHGSASANPFSHSRKYVPMTTTHSNILHAVPQRETAPAATPQQPQPQPSYPHAGAAAGHVQADSQRQRRVCCAIRVTSNFRPPATYGNPPWISGDRKLVFVNGTRITPKPVEWLWRGWIAKGFLTIIAGETGAGKSTILSDLVGRETTGRAWPGESEPRQPGQVLWLGSEDPLQEVTVPRLMASRTRMEHVNFIVTSSQRGNLTSVSLQEDLGSMMEALEAAREQNEPISLIVIDPVTSYLSGKVLRKVDMNDAGQIRTVLEPWSKLASLYNVAIVCVTHFAKDTNRSMLNRVLGSGAFSALSRAVIAITTLPEEAQEGNPYAKAMFLVKNNLPEQPEGAWRFCTMKTTVFDHANCPISATKIDWDTEPDHTLTPQNLLGVGKERGPLSQYAFSFPIWLKAQFLTTPPTEGLPVASLKTKAVAECAVTERWWNEHSSQHLDKRNIGGVWYCRPKIP